MEYRHSLDQRRATKDDAYRVSRAWGRCGWDVASRPLALTWASGRRMAEIAARGLFDTWAPSSVANGISREYANLALDLLAVPSSAAATAAARFDAAAAPQADPVIERALSGAAPVARAKPVDLAPVVAEEQMHFLAARAGGEVRDFDPETLRAQLPNRFLLPARVLDASQAWASWFVPVEVARGLLRKAVELGHQPGEVADAFEPVSVGPGEAMVSVLATDYRASDFGVLREIGLTLSVSPRGARFPDPGQIFLRLIVTDPWSLGAARQIWGIRKDYWDTQGITPRSQVDVSYSEDRARFGVKTFQPGTVAEPRTLVLDFPRFGAGRSEAVPSTIYSMAEPRGRSAGPAAPVRSTLRRSGAQEGVQYGGTVRIGLPETRDKGRDAGCLCSIGMACLCDTLRDLCLDRRKPAANGWTEHMTGQLEEPAPVAVQDRGNSAS